MPSNDSDSGVKNLAWQYKLLMWKNFLLLRRSPFRIIVEIIWPLALFLILTAVRSRQSLVERKHECHFHNKPMPSAGLLPFFQVCCLKILLVKIDDSKQKKGLMLHPKYRTTNYYLLSKHNNRSPSAIPKNGQQIINTIDGVKSLI